MKIKLNIIYSNDLTFHPDHGFPHIILKKISIYSMPYSLGYLRNQLTYCMGTSECHHDKHKAKFNYYYGDSSSKGKEEYFIHSLKLLYQEK